MPRQLGATLALGGLAGLGLCLLLAALILGLSALVGAVAALALVGVLCLALAALGLGLRRKPPGPGAELGMLVGIFVLRHLLRR